jgi:hypothetical protein
MEFWKAINLLEEGKLICREGWRGKIKYAFLDIYNRGRLGIGLKMENGDEIDFSPLEFDIFATDWFEYL